MQEIQTISRAPLRALRRLPLTMSLNRSTAQIARSPVRPIITGRGNRGFSCHSVSRSSWRAPSTIEKMAAALGPVAGLVDKVRDAARSAMR